MRNRKGFGWKYRPTLMSRVPKQDRDELCYRYGKCCDHSTDERFAKKWTKRKKRNLIAELDSILLAFDSAEFEKGLISDDRSVCNLPPRMFNEAILFGTEIDCLYGGLTFASAKPTDFPEGFDCSICQQGNEHTECDWQLLRLKSVPLKYARGHRLTSPFLAELDTCWVHRNGTFSSSVNLMNWGTDNVWRMIDAAKSVNEEGFHIRLNNGRVEQSNVCNFILGMAFSETMIWKVIFHFEEISLAVLCDIHAAAACFKDRDVDTGMSRRAALRHWVREHIRCKPGDDEKSVEVVRHLRGRVPFVWNGISCELVVSRSDEQESERLKVDRKSRRLTTV